MLLLIMMMKMMMKKGNMKVMIGSRTSKEFYEILGTMVII